ncbi:twin-arginine translocase subunit TatC [candidate division WOR-3 bacterium]|nr:twin-arginine translocase subunit TatC [candidate division WOR-3 bacterium]
MNFLQHLEELRKRLLYSAVALVAAAVAGYYFSGPILDILQRPVGNLVFLAPPEAFVTRLKVGFAAGLILAAPVIFYQFWRFVRPALMPGESRYVVGAVVSGTLLFGLGVAFALLVVLPFGLRFLMSFQSEELRAMLSVGRYVDFVAWFLFGFGLVFQLPIAIFFLTKLGVVTPRALRKHRRIAILIIVVAAAVLTPPDVVSQVLMAVPMLLLYEIGIIGSVFAARKKVRVDAG